MSGERILVVGGNGFFGRYLVDDLLRHTDARIVVVGRRTPAGRHGDGRVDFVSVDLHDRPRLRRIVDGAALVIHCAGPFGRLPIEPLDVALECGAHYVDIAEDRAFGRAVRDRDRAAHAAGVAVLTGSSVVPAMEALVLRWAGCQLGQIAGLRTFVAADVRRQRGPALIETMLSGVGRPFDRLRAGRTARAHGWTEPEWVAFPPPVGRRLTYLVGETADLDVLPAHFGLDTLELKAGSDLTLVNRALGLAGTVRARTGHPAWERAAPFARAVSGLAGRLGNDAGSTTFELTMAGDRQVEAVAVSAKRDGGRIPIAVAGLAAEELLGGRVRSRGVVPAEVWVTPERFIDSLRQRGLSVWHRADGEAAWRPIQSADELHRGAPATAGPSVEDQPAWDGRCAHPQTAGGRHELAAAGTVR
jgi:NAD(P)-dependent dehydrogenase (short-subunit alcohol dehydrogenase family)